MFTRVDTDFTQEYYNETKEDDCEQDTDPEESEDVGVTAAAWTTANLKVGGVELALVIDVTGSMGPEIGAVRDALNTYISVVDALPGTFPDTAVVTFTDGVFVNTISRDPETLRGAVAALGASGGGDCPESSNEALMTAGRLLARNGRAVLATDADSRPDGPSRGSVNGLFTSKGVRLSTLLSGSCYGGLQGQRGSRANGGGQADRRAAAGRRSRPRERDPDVQRAQQLHGRAVQLPARDQGRHRRVRRPATRTRWPTSRSRRSRPAVAAVNPTAVPQGTTLDLELTGSNTNFRSGSTLAVAGAGVSVLSTTRGVADAHRRPAERGARTRRSGSATSTVTTDGRRRHDRDRERASARWRSSSAPAEPTILAVTPSTGAVGSTFDVTISGGLTNFAAGVSVADFGAGRDGQQPHGLLADVGGGERHGRPRSGDRVPRRHGDDGDRGGGRDRAGSVPGRGRSRRAIPRLTQCQPVLGRARLDGRRHAHRRQHGVRPGRDSLASVTGQGVQVLSTTVTSPTSLVAKLQDRRRRAARVPRPDRHHRWRERRAAERLRGHAGGPGGSDHAAARRRSRRDRLRRPGAPGGALPQGQEGREGQEAQAAPARPRERQGLRGDDLDRRQVARVEVAISRKAGKKKCRFVQANGKLTKARSCKKPVFVRAKGTNRWSLSLKRKLPRGKYTIQVRARDAAGNRQSKTSQADEADLTEPGTPTALVACRTMRWRWACLGVLLLAAGCGGSGGGDDSGDDVRTVATGLEIPWEIAFLPDGRALVTERPGRVRLLDARRRLAEAPVAEVPVSAEGEGGLMGLALDPGFDSDPLVYLYFTTAEGMRVERWRLGATTGCVREATLVTDIRAGSVHDSGRIAFGPDERLYVATGDAGDGAARAGRRLAQRQVPAADAGAVPR